MARTHKAWSDDKRNAATVLFHAGLSAKDAAERFSAQHHPVTRNAMIGMWHRMKLLRGHAPAENKKPKRKASDVRKYGVDFNIAKAINLMRKPAHVTPADPVEREPIIDQMHPAAGRTVIPVDRISSSAACRKPIATMGVPIAADTRESHGAPDVSCRNHPVSRHEHPRAALAGSWMATVVGLLPLRGNQGNPGAR
jgi:hypothetical protein